MTQFRDESVRPYNPQQERVLESWRARAFSSREHDCLTCVHWSASHSAIYGCATVGCPCRATEPAINFWAIERATARRSREQ